MLAFNLDTEPDDAQQCSRSAVVRQPALDALSKNKFQLATYTKGFFGSDIDFDYDAPFSHRINRKQSEEKPNLEATRRKRRKRTSLILQPMKQSTITPVYENYQQKEECQLSSSPIILENNFLEGVHCQIKRMAKKRFNKGAKANTVQMIQKDQKKADLPKIKNFLFLQEEQAQSRTKIDSQNIQNIETTHQNKPEQCQINSNQSELSTSPNKLVTTVSEKSYYQPQQQMPLLASSNYFNYESVEQFKKEVSQSTKKDHLLRLHLSRDKDGLNTFWPEFHLRFNQSNTYIMSAKKTSSKPTSTFILSANSSNFQQNSQYYLGKMKSNVLGDVLNVFGPGLSPSNAREHYRVPRQLIATIVYSSSMFRNDRLREFQIFVKKEQFRYYSSFPQVVMYKDEIPLNLLYEFAENKQKIKVYYNRKPIWMEHLGGYRLNFKGRALVPSRKNFILEEQIIGPDVALFGKVNQSKFNLDVYHPISPLIAFAAALSSFDTRMVGE